MSTDPSTERIVVSTRSGRVLILGERRTDVAVDGARTSVDESGAITVHGSSNGVEVRCPAGSDVVVGTASGTVQLRGPLGDVRVTTRSGAIEAEETTTIEARSVSGRVNVATTRGARVRVTSGRVHVGLAPAGSADVSAVSGSVRIEVPAGVRPATSLRSQSGVIDAPPPGAEGAVSVRTVSGSITVSER